MVLMKSRRSGFPFNVLSVEDPDITAGISERQIGGLGVLLMKKLTDSVQYRYEGDKNILTLIFLKIKIISDK
jgi:anti-sigma regulatory factor (Ser/Thr protein kinase)